MCGRGVGRLCSLAPPARPFRCPPDARVCLLLQLLENTVKKIGGLLRVGFGQAGAPIIATNLQSSEGAFNPMVEGQRIHAIFGFIYILKFAKITEVRTALPAPEALAGGWWVPQRQFTRRTACVPTCRCSRRTC